LTTLLEIVLGGAASLALPPVALLFVEVLLAATTRLSSTPPEGERPRTAIVMPAHNEASVIVHALRSIVPQLLKTDRLIVVADNCTDDTAVIAAAEGAETIARADPTRRGKGYALDFGIRHLEADAPDVVIIIDADCHVMPGAIDRLARVCLKSARPVQALYLMFAPEGAAFMTRIGEFAWTVKNHVRPLGLHHLGLPCQLMGTGMAFPWSRIRTATLATGHIVEDLKLGVELARGGAPPLFCPQALVKSPFPSSDEGIQSQRARWEHGYLSVILSDAPRMFWTAIVSGNLQLIALAADLCVPPLALLALQVAIVWFVNVIFCLLTGKLIPLALSSIAAALLAASVLLSWQFFGRRIISLGDLALAGVYALRKIPLYARFLVSRQISWVRSKRDRE
jgi:glycosyltransferase involved in cell wall biosynthesis